MNPLSRLARVARVATLVTLALALPIGDADAAVRKEGAWPASDKNVSFDFEGKPSDGLKKLADEAGWSLVVSKGITAAEHDVKIDVEDQPADAVLEALFAESDVVARRTGKLITITPGHGAAAASADTPPPVPSPADAAAAPPSPPPIADSPAGTTSVPPVPTVRGADRSVFGSSLVVDKDEIVHTVTVTGGAAKIYGTVTGDLVVAGGSAKLAPGGRVVGNATVFGGSLKMESGSRIDGDVGVVGGSLKREDGAVIGGKVVDGAAEDHGRVAMTMTDGEVSTNIEEVSKPASLRSRVSEAAQSFGQSLTNMSLLFVFGCVLLALATRKMEVLRVEAAARPMKAFALGIVGSLAALVALTAMCVTLVGIPFALLGVVFALFVVSASVAAVLTTFGAAVAGHKSDSPYVHLVIGCGALLLVGVIPYIGSLVTFVVLMIAVGALVSTRLAGSLDGRSTKPDLV